MKSILRTRKLSKSVICGMTIRKMTQMMPAVRIAMGTNRKTRLVLGFTETKRGLAAPAQRGQRVEDQRFGASLLKFFIGQFEIKKHEFFDWGLPRLEAHQTGHNRNNET